MLLTDGAELHMASLRFVDTTIALEGQDHPAFAALKDESAALKDEFADVLVGPPPGLPPDRGIKLVLETGSRPMPRTRPIKCPSAGGLAELRRQLHDLLDRSWIQHSTAGHAASVGFARKQDGSWRICYDCQGLNAITEPLVEPLPHIDALLDETCSSCWFTKFDLAQGYHQVRLREVQDQLSLPAGPVREEDDAARPARCVVGSHAHHECCLAAGPPTGDFGAGGRRAGIRLACLRRAGARGPLHRSVVVYMDGLLCYSPSLEQHLQDVREALGRRSST